jgi:hypothetical protein
MRKSYVAAVAALLISGSAQATVYIVDLTLDGVAVKGSITTDGTIGRIDAGNILTYTFSFKLPKTKNYAALNVAFTGTSDYITQSGTWLTATQSDLNYNFVSPGPGRNLVVFDFDDPNQVASFCVQGRNCYNSKATPGLGVFRDNGGSAPVYFTSFTGVQSIAHVAAVPEPASWAMMVGGFGIVGFAMRSRRKAAVSFA